MKWFKHDSSAHSDAKLRKVKIKYGMEGYGLYWHCLEIICSDVASTKITFELEHDAEIISLDTGIHVSRVNEMLAYMVDLRLFELSNNIITCMKMAKRIDKSMTSNMEMRKIISGLGLNNHDSVMTKSGDSHDTVMTKSEQNRIEENRREEKRLEEKRLDKKRKEKPKTLQAASRPRAKKPAVSSKTWDAYANAYLNRYGTDPVRNARINGQLVQFVKRVGEKEAPQIAAWYVDHQNSWYIQKCHGIDGMLKDAEALRTQWATQTEVTATQARQKERTSHNARVVQDFINDEAG